MKAELNWREIFDCKIAGTHRDVAQKRAREAGYKYFCHNGTIFVVADGEPIECLKTIAE